MSSSKLSRRFAVTALVLSALALLAITAPLAAAPAATRSSAGPRLSIVKRCAQLLGTTGSAGCFQTKAAQDMTGLPTGSSLSQLPTDPASVTGSVQRQSSTIDPNGGNGDHVHP